MKSWETTHPHPVPYYLRNYVPRTLETMYYVLQAPNYVPSILDIMYFHHKFDKKVEYPQ